jgi:DDE superfamily endonuclease
VAELKISACSHAVAILASSARGVPLPPFVILRGAAVDSTKPAVFYPPEFKDACFFNSRGRRDEDLMLYWFRDHFLRCMPYQRGRPLVLLMPRPVASDVSLRLVQLAADESVSLVCLPVGISHLLQPLSSSILRMVDAAVSSHVEHLSAQGRLPTGGVMTPSSLALVLASVWNNEWPTADVNHAFTDSGIYPLNVRAITVERIASCAPDEIEMNSDTRDQDVESEGDDDDSTDDAEHGLNLLSELSTMEQMQDNASTHQRIPYCAARRPVRLRTDDSYYDSVYSKLGRRRREPKVSDELMRRILGGEGEDAAVGSSRTHPTSNPLSRRSDVHVEIAAARNNYDQINRAVDSIVSEGPSSCSTRRRPGRPRTVPNKQEDPQLGQTLKNSNAPRTAFSGRSSVKHEKDEAVEREVDVGYINLEQSNASTSWLSTPVETGSAAIDRKDVIEEVDLSDFYVNVEDGTSRLADHTIGNNNAKSVVSGSNSSVVQCDLRQLASQLQPDQKVDIIQNIMIGGRTVQIIRRLTFEDILRSSDATVNGTNEDALNNDVVEDEVVELDATEQISTTECEDYLQVSMEETV